MRALRRISPRVADVFDANKYTILALILLFAIGVVAVDQVRIGNAQDKTERAVAQAAEAAQLAKRTSARQSRIIKDNTRNIQELRRQKANILTLKRTNCGVRLAMLKAAEGAKATRGAEAAAGYRRIANLFPAENCKGLGALPPTQSLG